MLNHVAEIMIYVYDHNKAIQFWTEHLNFTVVEVTEEMEMCVVKLQPNTQAQTLIVLQDKAKVDAMDMGVSTTTPSLIFSTNEFDRLYQSLTEQGVNVGEIMTLPMGRVFNFSDYEDNYFAVKDN